LSSDPDAVERVVAGHRVLHFASVTSTSEVARERLRSGLAAAGDLVLADEQTTGRGRRGRAWVTLPGALAASLVMRPPPLARPGRLAVLAAVAACRALAACGAGDVRIKWPNDLMRGEAKIGGLLAESVEGPLVVLGVGINLAGPVLPAELRGRAGDAGLPATDATRQALLAALLAELDAALAEVGTPADAARGENYRRLQWLVGRSVSLTAAGRPLAGTITDVTADGDLVLDGRLLPGETVELDRPSVPSAPPSSR
jgi:BirA family biotin operon repressor/biotin-[acetyl-CoA-carboxylase] ligase